MAYIDLAKESFDDTLDKNEIVIIDFWAPWCGPCIQFGPIFEKVSENYILPQKNQTTFSKPLF